LREKAQVAWRRAAAHRGLARLARENAFDHGRLSSSDYEACSARRAPDRDAVVKRYPDKVRLAIGNFPSTTST
jgi:hypothetical protein